MECKDCPMRLFEVKVYAMSKNNVKLYIEDAKISPTWMLQKDIDKVNAQFMANPNLENARYVEKTGVCRCVGYSVRDENFKYGITYDYNRYRSASSYGKVVMLNENEGTNAYRSNCFIGSKWIDVGCWKTMIDKYKDIDDDWF